MTSQRGQATVELVLVLPLIALLLLGMTQLAVVIAAQVRVVDASRAAARAAAVDDDPRAPERAVAATGLVGPRVSVQVSRHDRMVVAEVDSGVPTVLPVVGVWIRDTMLTARTAMREERATAGLRP